MIHVYPYYLYHILVNVYLRFEKLTNTVSTIYASSAGQGQDFMLVGSYQIVDNHTFNRSQIIYILLYTCRHLLHQELLKIYHLEKKQGPGL